MGSPFSAVLCDVDGVLRIRPADGMSGAGIRYRETGDVRELLGSILPAD